ncbi:unnamed protein product [Vitrella brassicaformis CCMP3155]|uniref:Uncharacterized protein n=2 Tax=Vitrella brassicaformis TaxID=1169539 RepID=A0A0G4EG56_VITBC|nr:unnamed protein product [Vitrella brassicaformis CCMP3155]|eukprot:CEL94366.1 unnamed protein product [Vitrella brassicaformis CCMP3155]
MGFGGVPPEDQEHDSDDEQQLGAFLPPSAHYQLHQGEQQELEERRALALRQEQEKASQEEAARMKDRQEATEKQLRAARLHERHLKSKISRQAEDILDKTTEIDELRKRANKRTSDDTRPGRLAGVLMASPHRLQPLSDSRHRQMDDVNDKEDFEDVHFLPHPVHHNRHQRSPSLPPPALPKLNLKEVHEERDRNYPPDQVAAAAAAAPGVDAAGKGGSSSASSASDDDEWCRDMAAVAAPTTHKRQDTDRQESDDDDFDADNRLMGESTARYYMRKYDDVKNRYDAIKDMYHHQEKTIAELRSHLAAAGDNKTKLLADKDAAAAKAADEWFKMEHVLRTTIGKQQRELDMVNAKLQEAERTKATDAVQEPSAGDRVAKDQYDELQARLDELQEKYSQLMEEAERLKKVAAANVDKLAVAGGETDVPTDGDLARLLSGCDLPPEVTAAVHRVDQTLDGEVVRADRLAREATSLRKMAEQKEEVNVTDEARQEAIRHSHDDEQDRRLQQIAKLQRERDGLQREKERLEQDKAQLVSVLRAYQQHLKAAGGVPVAGAARLLSHKSQIQTHSTSGGRGASIGAVKLGHKAPPAAAISTGPGARVASHADVVGVDGRIATPPTDVRVHARKQRSDTASAGGRRKWPSPPQTANGPPGGVERSHGGETAAMIGPGVGIRTGGGSGDPFAALAGMIGASGTKAPRPFTALTASDAPKTLAVTQDHRQKTAPALKKAEQPRLSIVMTRIANEPPSFDVAKTRLPVVGEGVVDTSERHTPKQEEQPDDHLKSAPMVKKAERPKLSIVMTRIANEPPSFDVAKTRLPVVGEGVGIDIEADRVGARLWNGKGIPPVVHHSFAEHHRHHPKCGPLTPANALILKLQQAQTQGKADTNKRAVGVIMSGQPLSPPLLHAKAHAASATMPRRIPDLRLPATISAQSRQHGHRQQQQRYIQPPLPEPPPAMAFAPPPPYATIGQPLFYALRHTHLTS